MFGASDGRWRPSSGLVSPRSVALLRVTLSGDPSNGQLMRSRELLRQRELFGKYIAAGSSSLRARLRRHCHAATLASDSSAQPAPLCTPGLVALPWCILARAPLSPGSPGSLGSSAAVDRRLRYHLRHCASLHRRRPPLTATVTDNCLRLDPACPRSPATRLRFSRHELPSLGHSPSRGWAPGPSRCLGQAPGHYGQASGSPALSHSRLGHSRLVSHDGPRGTLFLAHARGAAVVATHATCQKR